MGDSNHAIVFGASGLIGWALVNQLLSAYPDAGTFSKVTAITNRPITLSESHWPTSAPDRPDLQLVSGIDLRHGDGATLAETLKHAVREVESVTHIYYLVFTAVKDESEEFATNLRMFKNVIDAHGLISPNLQFVVVPGGTRGYGIYSPGGTFTPPLTEGMVNRLPIEAAKTIVYPAYRKLLNEKSKGKQWTWCEVCPDAIVGFTPNGSQFSLALHWAQYLSLWAYNHGIGPETPGSSTSAVQVPFPGSVAGANSLFTPVSSSTLARFMIYASLHPEICGEGHLFNIADNENPCKYGELWPQLASWFGLVGVGPVEDSQAIGDTLKAGELPKTTEFLTPGEYITEHQDKFAALGRVNAVSGGVSAGRRQLDSVGYWLTFDRQLSLEKIRGTGFEGDRDHVQGWLETFEMFRKAGLIL
ncbi:uncharacterized protein N7484_003113 [Penicillium longicatenatum]|uniref:uncharacterized protein n=1 Tax=Penicillium longicatenatum TaxID=1561947 RepID=UPI002546A46D|nr:uncharacterized protein N7484_003113 [Penicillium longicatenatum]KAJ5649390.1 hypothetical protein N7484_003113 [Penicillium longicatenatum]